MVLKRGYPYPGFLMDVVGARRMIRLKDLLPRYFIVPCTDTVAIFSTKLELVKEKISLSGMCAICDRCMLQVINFSIYCET